MNNFSPVLLLALLANMDIQAVTGKHGVMEYITKYATKFSGSGAKGSPMKVAEQMFDDALTKAKDSGKGTMAWHASLVTP